MSCVVVYQDKKYSLEEFKNVLKTDKNLYTELLSEVKASLSLVMERFKKDPDLVNHFGDIYAAHKFAINNIPNFKNEPTLLNTENVVKIIENYQDLSVTREFGMEDAFIIMQEVIAQTFSSLDITESIRSQDLYKLVETKYTEILSELRKENRTDEADFMEAMKDDILGKNGYENSIKQYITYSLGIEETQEMIELAGENVKDHNQSSFEIDVTKALGLKVKLMLSGVGNNNQDNSFGGFKNYMSNTDALDALKQILLKAKTNTLQGVLDAIDKKVAMNPKEFQFYKEIGEKLKNISDVQGHTEVIDQILYNLYQSEVQMKFTMWNRTANGKLVIKSLDANAKNPLFIKRNEWREAIKHSGLIDVYEKDFYNLNEEGVEYFREVGDRILAQYAEGGVQNVNREDLKSFLLTAGITLNEKSIDNFYDSQYVSANGKTVSGLLMGNDNAIVPILMKNVERAIEKVFDADGKPIPDNKLSFSGNPVGRGIIHTIDLLTYDNSQLNELILLDNDVEFRNMGTMYIADKLIQMYQQNNPITNKVRLIKTGLEKWEAVLADNTIPEEEKENHLPKELSRFLHSKITSNSNLLNVFKRNPAEAKKYFETFLISLESLKEQGSKSRDDMGIANLSDKDYWVTMLGMFTSSEGKFEDIFTEEQYGGTIKFRKTYMSTSTLSDASNLPFLKTLAIELDNYLIEEDTNEFAPELLQYLTDQLVVGDLRRYADYYKNVKGDSNIDGYDVGAKFLTGLAGLNTIVVNTGKKIQRKDGEVDQKVSFIKAFELFLEDKGKENISDATVQEFIEQYEDVIHTEVKDYIDYETNRFISEDGSTGVFVENDIVDEFGSLNITDGKSSGNSAKDNSYYKGKSARLLAYDLAINSVLNQREFQNLFGGDVAFYFKDKMGNGLQHGLPKITLSDIVAFEYYDRIKDIKEIFNSTLGKAFDNKESFADRIKKADSDKIEALREALNAADMNLLTVSSELITSNDDYLTAYEKLQPIARGHMNALLKDVQNNLSKRLKGQLSPGNQFPDTSNLDDTYQIVLDDSEIMVETMKDLVERHYPNLANNQEFMDSLQMFEQLDKIQFKTEEQKTQHKSLHDKLKKEIPNIAAYLKTTATDAQEYSSWKDALNQLKFQGRLTPTQYNTIEKKLIAQSADLANYKTDEKGNYIGPGEIHPDNKLTKEEMKLALFQPSKPLYSGLVEEDINGHKVNRYVYIKTSSFPLIPELTAMFPKLDNMRKVMEHIEKTQEGVSTRVTYHSGVKVGAPKKRITAADMQKVRTDAELDTFIAESVNNSKIILPKENFYIQQDKPYKFDKYNEAGKELRTVRATQFEKIILGDGISNITENIFPANNFDKSLLEDLGIKIEDDLISGVDLQKIYIEIYKREQTLLAQKFFDRLGIESYDDIAKGKPEVMRELSRIAKSQVNSIQDKEVLDLVHYVRNESGVLETKTEEEVIEGNLIPESSTFRMPLMMSPNSQKFESMFGSLVNKNNINLTLPGSSYPVASQEGFDMRGYSPEVLENLKKNGLILTDKFDPNVGLRSETKSEDGKLSYAQVFVASKYTIFNPETGKNEEINMADYVNKETGTLDLTKFPEELLSMFSFRIPTSRHQSGAVVEIVGFLPHNMGDLMIVPREHTVQIGEDYDIDVRYAYQYNYFKDKDGNIKIMSYDDVASMPEGKYKELKDTYYTLKDELWDSFYYKNEDGEKKFHDAFMHAHKPIHEERAKLKAFFKHDMGSDPVEYEIMAKELSEYYEIDNITKEWAEEKYHELESKFKDVSRGKQKARAKELNKEFYDKLKEIEDAYGPAMEAWKKYLTAKQQKITEVKVMENNLVALYKSVFSANDDKVRNMITAVLSTDFSEESAVAIDGKLSTPEKHFSIYSPHTQRKVMKLGADGKMGIGVHSNAVTINSLLQQLPEKIKMVQSITPEGNVIPYNIMLGEFNFTGILGEVKNKYGRHISEYLSESQNSATDNQKLEIMGRRNENSVTISVFSFMQMAGLEEDSFKIEGNKLSYASLFIAQPAILKFVNLAKKYQSSTEETFGDTNDMAIEDVKQELIDRIDPKEWAKDENGSPIIGRLPKSTKESLGKSLTSQRLYDQITPLENYDDVDPLVQYYIMETFHTLQKPAKELGELQSFINIEKDGMGISYFDTIRKKKFFDKINAYDVVGATTGRSSSPMKLLFGEEIRVEKGADSPGNDYIKMWEQNGQDVYIKPTTHYSHKIMNSLQMGYNTWNSIFPYDHKSYERHFKSILNIAGLKEDTNKGTELMYSIMSGMKDFSYSTNLTLFGTNPTEIKNKIMFDDKSKNQESLGGYLSRMKDNPGFADFMKKPFFRDLQIELGGEGYPSIIKYLPGDMSPINSLLTNNYLTNMVNSKKELPARKGETEPMTEERLMKELLMYSLIADQGNGAIGFRKVLPISLFEKEKVEQNLRRTNNIRASVEVSKNYDGYVNFLQIFSGNKFDDRGVLHTTNKGQNIRAHINRINNEYKIKTKTNVDHFTVEEGTGNIINNLFTGEPDYGMFVRQYVQHNPDIVKKKFTYNESEKSALGKLLSANGASLESLNSGTFIQFNLKREGSKVPSDYVTIKDEHGFTHLYERYTPAIAHDSSRAFYKEIPRLGVFGFNEYDQNKNVNVSAVSKNNLEVDYTEVERVLAEGKSNLVEGDLNQVLNIFSANYNGPYTALIKVLQEYLPDANNIGIEIKNMAGNSPARYTRSEDGTSTITISQSFFNSPDLTSQKLQDAVMEEVLHHVTSTSFARFIKITGISPEGKVEYEKRAGVDTPASLIGLLNVYEAAIESMMNKHGKEAFFAQLNRIKNDQVTAEDFENDKYLDTYRTSSVHEFIAGLLIKGSNFRTEMANTNYLSTNKSVLSKFAEKLLNFLNRLLPNNRKGTIAAEAVTELINFLEVYDKTTPAEKNYLKNPIITNVSGSLGKSGEQINNNFGKQINNLVGFERDPELDSNINKDNPDFSKHYIADNNLYGEVYAKELLTNNNPFHSRGISLMIAYYPENTVAVFEKSSGQYLFMESHPTNIDIAVNNLLDTLLAAEENPDVEVILSKIKDGTYPIINGNDVTLDAPETLSLKDEKPKTKC